MEHITSIMKRFLLVIAVGVTGFAAGSWTPLGDMASLENLAGRLGLTTSSNVVAESKLESSFDRQRRALAVSAVNELVSAIDPDASQKQNASGSGELVTETTELLFSNMLNQMRSAGVDTFAPVTFGQLDGAIQLLETENSEISTRISQTNPDFPEHYFLKSMYQVNLSTLAMTRFLNTADPTDPGSLASGAQQLIPVLDRYVGTTEANTRIGRMNVEKILIAIGGLPRSTEQERRMGDLLTEMAKTYLVSFDVEDALAQVNAIFPRILISAINGTGSPDDSQNWTYAFQTLVNARYELIEYRRIIAGQLAATS